MNVAKVTVRLPVEIHRRLVEHRRATRVPTNAFVERAVEAALDKERLPRPKRRKIAG